MSISGRVEEFCASLSELGLYVGVIKLSPENFSRLADELRLSDSEASIRVVVCYGPVTCRPDSSVMDISLV